MQALWLGLLACGPSDPDADPSTVSSGDPPACDADWDCPTGEVCHGGACEVGDRDDTTGGATPLALDAVGSGVIATEGDVDTFVYTADAPQWVRIETTTTAEDPVANLDTVLRLYGPSGSLHAEIDNFPTGRVLGLDSVLFAWLPSAGDWFLTVEDVASFYGADALPDRLGYGPDFAYTVTVTDFGPGTQEPDGPGDPSAVVDITSGSTIWSVGVLIDAPGDVDALDLSLPTATGQPLEVWGPPSIPGSTLDAEVSLWRDDEVHARLHPFGAGAWLSRFGATAGSYALQVTDAAGDGGPSAWTVVYIRTYEAEDVHPFFGDDVYVPEVEPNDLTPEAVLAVEESGLIEPYTVGAVEGTLADEGDADAFLWAVPAGQRVSVRCFGEAFGSLADLRASVWVDGIDQTPVGQGDLPLENDFYVADVDPAGAPTVEVRLTAAPGTFGPGAYYRCRLLSAPFLWL